MNFRRDEQDVVAQNLEILCNPVHPVNNNFRAVFSKTEILRMSDSAPRKSISEPMSEKIFQRFSKFIQTELGIKMPDTKRTMLQARLQKRLWKLDIGSFDEYCDYLFSKNWK
jgi:hypothetical protein